MLEVVEDILKDSIKVFPFIFLIYILMEVLKNAKKKEKYERALSGGFSPVFASLIGVVPECGFSVMCAKLYDSGFITTGTLVSAFIASSDEGVIVMLSNGTNIFTTLMLVLIKVLYAIFLGLLLNIILKKWEHKHVCPKKDDCIECGEHHAGFMDKYILHTFSHATKVFIFVLVINFVFGFLIYFIGEDNISQFMLMNKYLQPFIACLIGLIPNCASSVILAQSFSNGILSFSALVAGLSSNAGLGLIMLFRKKERAKRNIFITLVMYLGGVFIGILCLICNIWY